MRWITAAVLTVAHSVAVAQTAADLLVPSPWGVGIAIAQWIMKDDRKVFYVDVTARGSSAREAQEQAMRMAVERAVGSVLASAAVAEQGRLARDEIIVYSAGYVDDHRVVEQRLVDGQTQVRMEIWVSHSRLAHRLLGESRAEGAIEGGRISEQIASFQRARSASDEILLTVLRDYPYRSFAVSLQRTRVWVDTDRQTYLDIPFLLTWDPNYISSLAEAVRVINQRPECASFWSGCALGSRHQPVTSMIRVGSSRAWFDDTVAYDLMYREMIESQPKVRLRLFDAKNAQRYEQCFNLAELDQRDWTNWTWADVSGRSAEIDPDRRQMVKITVRTQDLPMQDLDRAEIDVIRLADCAKRRR